MCAAYDQSVSRSKKPFKDYTPAQQLLLGILMLASLLLVGAAERDLQHRRSEQVRGRKLIWRLVSLNALGAAIYLRWGRRGAAGSVLGEGG